MKVNQGVMVKVLISEFYGIKWSVAPNTNVFVKVHSIIFWSIVPELKIKYFGWPWDCATVGTRQEQSWANYLNEYVPSQIIYF